MGPKAFVVKTWVPDPNDPLVKAANYDPITHWREQAKKDGLRKPLPVTKKSERPPPPEAVTPESIERLKAYGREQGYTDNEMELLLFQRLHLTDWNEMVPFNLTFLRMIFKHRDKPRWEKKL